MSVPDCISVHFFAKVLVAADGGGADAEQIDKSGFGRRQH